MRCALQGLRDIANRVHMYTALLRKGLISAGHQVGSEEFFDTLTVKIDRRMGNADLVVAAAEAKRCVPGSWHWRKGPGGRGWGWAGGVRVGCELIE